MRMAVGTEQPKVFATVVVVDAVDVIEVKDERPTTPFDDAADRAAILPTHCEKTTHEAGR